MAEGYRTRQRTLVLSLLKRLGDRHLTAEEISRYLAEEGSPVGKATVYRCLDRLVEQGTGAQVSAGRGGERLLSVSDWGNAIPTTTSNAPAAARCCTLSAATSTGWPGI